jgi:hypothetical protein
MYNVAFDIFEGNGFYVVTCRTIVEGILGRMAR